MFNVARNSKVRTRFAPSPTGYLHIGNLRTALFAWLIAKRYQGNFILRIEDTDQKRLIPGSVEKILEALNWLKINPDEGVVGKDQKGNFLEKGKFGPYFQSKRLSLYQECAQRLVNEKKAYYCFCSPERLIKMREKQKQKKQLFKYDGFCREISLKEAQKRLAKGEKAVIRMKIPSSKKIEVNDLIYGKIKIWSNNLDDQVILKSDGFPTYHLAVVVDDYLMKISHVVRGEDWIPSAPKHILLYDFLGWEKPIFIHLPNVLGKDKKKLSKRAGDVSVSQFVEWGYLPEALFNFLALLGWNPKNNQEIFSRNELINKFNENNLHHSGAVFDQQKLDWMNGFYLRKKTTEELELILKPFFDKFLKERKIEKSKNIESKIKKIIEIEKSRLKKASDILENIEFYFKKPSFEKDLIKWKEMTDQEVFYFLQLAEKSLQGITKSQWEIEIIQKELIKIAQEKRGEMFWPLRVALSGKKQSPSPSEIAWVLGKKETLRRIVLAQQKLKNKD